VDGRAEEDDMSYDVSTITERGRHLAVTRFDARPEVDDMGQKSSAAFGGVASYLARIGVPVAGPAISVYEMEGDLFHVAAGFVVEAPFEPGEGVEPLQLPACEVATTVHIGPYERLGEAYEALQKGVVAQGRQVEDSGVMWEEYWSGPEAPPEETRTVVFWPLRPLQG
jgi:effector-binding domain-containing protein